MRTLAPGPELPPRRPRAARLGLLLLALLAAASWAFAVRRERRARATWDRTLEIAVVVLSREPDDPGATVLRAGAGALAERLAAEMARHRGPGVPPFAFRVHGPVTWNDALPLQPADGGALERVRHAVALWRARRALDAAAALPDDPFDATLYVLLEPAGGARSFAEGAGALGGEVGLVRAAVDGGDASLALAAMGHELLHCLGASDKYDGAGHAVEPGGLVEPALEPRYPQRLAEWMVGEVPLARGRGRLPASLAELAVGDETAREIGWTPAPGPRDRRMPRTPERSSSRRRARGERRVRAGARRPRPGRRTARAPSAP